eukprot:TRINITY_DN117_c0_g1_i3.p2 TRINITY_DN117_c0_g1~~TRINITY_DN117_c0_g1_i3.p2  ORF type:complete len:292 (-),score=22.55 TRINITY_DN117_c0_g1_i3:272-1147(-)
MFGIKVYFVVVVLAALAAKANGYRQRSLQLLSTSPSPSGQETTLCVVDSVTGTCKANPLVKNYLFSSSFAEQQLFGYSQCMVEDNPADCNALSNCYYEEDVDGSYTGLFDRDDLSLCLYGSPDTSVFDLFGTPEFKAQQLALANCFVEDSPWYLISYCQSVDICTGICGSQDLILPNTCTVDISQLDYLQSFSFLTFSFQLASALENNDNQALEDLVAEEIAPDASEYCQLLPSIFPCLTGLISGDICNIGNPAQWYWSDPADLELFEQSRGCVILPVTTCTTSTVSLGNK